jgi:hypothetical protein
MNRGEMLRRAFTRAGKERWGKVIRRANMKVE